MLELQLIRIEYRVGGSNAVSLHTVELEVPQRPRFGAGVQPGTQHIILPSRYFDLGLSVEGERVELSATPKKPLRITKCELVFKRAFDSQEKVLLNGYQSWTDTVEKPPFVKPNRLAKAFRGVTDHFHLDGGGDYRFTEYGDEPGQYHGWTYAYFRGEDGCEMVASLGEDEGFTLIRCDAADGTVSLEPECPADLMVGRTAAPLAKLALLGDAGNDVDALFQRWFQLMGVTARTRQPLTGYSSWYRHYDKIDLGKLLADLKGASKAYVRLDAGGFRKVFQIDDGYAPVGDWLNVRTSLFPLGMAPLAKEAAEAGFTPGIWMAPFVCEEDSDLFRNHPDWIMRRADGRMVRTGPHWTGGYALDTLNPQVRDHVTASVRTAVQEWGFQLLKLDFLYAACLVPHGGMNRGQLMADGLDLLRQAAGEDTLLLLCGVPLGSAFGRADYCRIGCDVGLDWNDKPHMRVLNRERVSSKNSLANTVFRAPLNGRAFMNDPDVVFLRDNTRMTKKQRSLLLDGAACFGGMLLTSDDMGSWDNGKLETFQEALNCMKAAQGI